MQFIAADVLHIELYNYKICNINTCSIWNNLHKLHSPYPHNIYNYFTFSFPIAVRMSIEQNKKQKHLHTISCSEISMKFEITEWDLHLGDIHQSLHRVSSSFRNRANNSYRNVKSEKKKKKKSSILSCDFPVDWTISIIFAPCRFRSILHKQNKNLVPFK